MSRKPLSFSICDTDAICAAVADRAPANGYPMSLVGQEAQWVADAANQGIDSHLTACNVPERGDVYTWQIQQGITGQVRGRELSCRVSRESLPVLVRRLLESDAPESPSGDHPSLLASSICDTLGIECI